MVCTALAGTDMPRIESPREAWLDAPDAAAQQAAAVEELPYPPLGQSPQATSYVAKLNAFALFWNVKKET